MIKTRAKFNTLKPTHRVCHRAMSQIPGRFRWLVSRESSKKLLELAKRRQNQSNWPKFAKGRSNCCAVQWR